MRPPLSLKGRALAMLAQREHSAAELRRKLMRRAAADPAADPAVEPAADVDEVIAWLRAHNYLSEERFVESRVHQRAARYGNLRIKQELAQHGLALTPEAVQALRDNELERATEVWRRKYGNRPASAAERARQSRFLASRGFSAETVARVMRGAGRSFAGADPATDMD
jgi:regulatory protein